MNKEEIKQEPNDGLIARILGGTPTILQKVFFILMAFSLILWPLGCYVSIFFFDAPVRSDVDKICRYGMLITIYLYPIYLFPLLRFMRHFLLTIVIVLVIAMGLSSCLCQPRSVSFSHLVEKIDSINTHFYTLQQAPPDSGVLLKETLVKELLGDIFYHRKEVQNREVRLVGVSQPYTQVLACAFNIKSIGFEWKTNETFLVTYGHDGKIADALYLGINEITPTFIKFSFNSKRHIPTEDIQRSKWVYNEQSNLLKLEVFEENSWLDEDKNPCLDNYYHTFFYRIDEQGRIVRLRKGKIVPYKYNHSDHAYDSYLKAAHKRFALQFTPYSERHMK